MIAFLFDFDRQRHTMHMVVYLAGTVIVILVVKAAKIRLSDYLL